jgi:hypothetical protein
MLDSTTDDAISDKWQRRRPAHLADPGLFDFAEPAADAVLRHNNPENP